MQGLFLKKPHYFKVAKSNIYIEVSHISYKQKEGSRDNGEEGADDP